MATDRSSSDTGKDIGKGYRLLHILSKLKRHRLSRRFHTETQGINAFAFTRKETGGYKTTTEDLRPKNEDPFKFVLKSLENGSNMIFD